MPLPQSLWEPDPRAVSDSWWRDGVITALATLFLAMPYVLMHLSSRMLQVSYGEHSGGAGQALVALAFTIPLLIRRHYPLLTALLMAAAGLMMVVVAPWPMLPVLLVPFVVFSVARRVPGPTARIAVVLGLLGALLGPARWAGTMALGMWTPGIVLAFLVMAGMCAGFVLTPYAIGRRVAEVEEMTRREAERRQMMAAAHERERAIAEATSRNSIARELHDIVAHSVSVMVVQAEGGRALAAKKPEAAIEALDTIAESGREALSEMRRIVAVLRQDPSMGAEYGPPPGLSDIGELVARTPNSSLMVQGSPVPVSPVVGLTVYRIVQEALTNVLKHAGGDARATVTLRHDPGLLQVEVADDGRGEDPDSDGMGHGLRGMQERVASMGGTLSVGPRPEGGFRVQACIPCRAATSATAQTPRMG